MNMIDGELMFPALHPFANGDSLNGRVKSDYLNDSWDLKKYILPHVLKHADRKWMIESYTPIKVQPLI